MGCKAFGFRALGFRALGFRAVGLRNGWDTPLDLGTTVFELRRYDDMFKVKLCIDFKLKHEKVAFLMWKILRAGGGLLLRMT